jgi:methionyl-tRNA synthetase
MEVSHTLFSSDLFINLINSFENDKDFSMTKLVRIANSNLADGIGNLVNRCCGKNLNSLQIRLAVSPSDFEACGSPGLELLDLLQRTPDIVHEEYLQWNFYK